MSRSEIIQRLLVARGIAAEDAEKFFNPSVSELAKPEKLPGIIEASAAILDAVEAKKEIVVFGDYDCDGVCATAIMTQAIGAIPGAKVTPFLPERLSEGYGMTLEAIKRMFADTPGVGLIVTVDNGINAIEEIGALESEDIRVVVTDHHLPGDELPAATAIANPKVASPDEFKDLCGAGVAFLLANRVISDAKSRGLYSGGSIGGPLLVLAGLATVTDIMPIRGQNRILVAEALKRFRASAPLGLRELYERAARVGSTAITARDFAFMLGPRINAAGRVKSGMEALELVLTADRDIARELARIVDLHNLERKTIEQGMTDEAMAKIVPGAPAQVIDLPNGHPGVAGIVASRVLERLEKPSPVCVIVGDHGSARAPAGFNLRDAFVACSAVLERYGGHAAAGGLSVAKGKIDEFRKLLCDYTASMKLALPKSGEFDEVELWLEPTDVDLELAEEIAAFEPFGEGNPEPIFGFKNVHIADLRTLGADGRHLSMGLAECPLRCVQWGGGDKIEEFRRSCDKPCDLSFTVAISDYGSRHVELRLRSFSA